MRRGALSLSLSLSLSPQQREAESFGYAPTPPRGALQWVGAEGHPRQQRPFVTRPAPADREPCPSFLHRSPAPHRPRHGTALSYHETSLTWSPLQPQASRRFGTGTSSSSAMRTSAALASMRTLTECVHAVALLGWGHAKGVRGNLPPLRRPVLCWPNACPVRACAGPCGPCENRRLHPFSPACPRRRRPVRGARVHRR